MKPLKLAVPDLDLLVMDAFLHAATHALSSFLPYFFYFILESLLGKVMVAYTMPQQRKKKVSEKLRGEREIRSSLLILDLKDGKL